MKGDRLRGHLDLLLLSVLQSGPAHGYAVVTELRDRSDGAFDLAEGTIYPALHRLEDAGWVTSAVALVDGRRRRTYRLTARGRRAFAAQQREWHGFVAGVQAVLG